MKNILSKIIFIIIIIVSFIFIKNNLNEFSSIPKFSLIYIWPMIILSLLTIFVNGLRVKLFGGYYNINLKVNEWFGLSAITTMGNHLTPFRTGVAARALYLKKVHKFPYTSFLTTMAASYILRFFIYGLFGIVLSLIILRDYIFFNILFSALVLITIFPFIVFLIFPIFKKTKNNFINKIIKILNEWNVMRKNYRFLFKIVLLDISILLIRAFRLFFAFKAFSFDVPFILILLISVFSMLSVFISLTPAGLGIVEGIVAFSSEVVGIGFVGGVYASVLDRIIAVIIIFILGPIFSYRLMRNSNFGL
tara:strand:+ start:5042 stop:5959 length:918 start_codon:yes stop_codon:yes gene_type:complete